MYEKLYAQIQGEFSLISATYADKEEAILADEKLVTMHSKYNLYEIQPYYAQLNNSVLNPELKLIIESEDDFDPEIDDLYDYLVNLENRRTYLKKQHYGDGIFYATVYEYTNEYYKSFTVYQNDDTVKTTNLSYLYLKDGLPHQYIECTEYGVSLKTYTCEDGLIKSYKLEWPNYGHHCIGELSYDVDGELIKIVETASDGRSRIMFEDGLDSADIETVLAELEDFLVENIADQIIEKVRINEPVYCILFEYTMQGPFPPTLAFGVASEINGKFEDNELYELYNAPDMRYFSENDEPNPIKIDFYPMDIQSCYLVTDAYNEKIPWENDAESEKWEEQVKNTYLNVCKRLMHYDFSASFQKTEHFLVMARDFEQCNEEEYYEILSAYKKEKGL